jgi:hypothetical protein
MADPLSTLSLESRDQAWAESMGMGAFLSVARGSYEPPKFLEIRYNGGPKVSRTIFLFLVCAKNLYAEFSHGAVSARILQRCGLFENY